MATDDRTNHTDTSELFAELAQDLDGLDRKEMATLVLFSLLNKDSLLLTVCDPLQWDLDLLGDAVEPVTLRCAHLLSRLAGTDDDGLTRTAKSLCTKMRKAKH